MLRTVYYCGNCHTFLFYDSLMNRKYTLYRWTACGLNDTGWVWPCFCHESIFLLVITCILLSFELIGHSCVYTRLDKRRDKWHHALPFPTVLWSIAVCVCVCVCVCSWDKSLSKFLQEDPFKTVWGADFGVRAVNVTLWVH